MGQVDCLVAHHGVFDRPLVAQTLYEPFRLVTADRHLAKCTDLVIEI
ncbi:twitching motility protein PilT [Burkholderia sp. Bp8963]|nr:twitching motility protein PilT [Burkholderia sp. Bp8963]